MVWHPALPIFWHGQVCISVTLIIISVSLALVPSLHKPSRVACRSVVFSCHLPLLLEGAEGNGGFGAKQQLPFAESGCKRKVPGPHAGQSAKSKHRAPFPGLHGGTVVLADILLLHKHVFIYSVSTMGSRECYTLLCNENRLALEKHGSGLDHFIPMANQMLVGKSVFVGSPNLK